MAKNAFRLFPVMEHRSGFSGIPTEVLVPLFGPILIRLQAAESLQGKPPESAWLEWGEMIPDHLEPVPEGQEALEFSFPEPRALGHYAELAKIGPVDLSGIVTAVSIKYGGGGNSFEALLEFFPIDVDHAGRFQREWFGLGFLEIGDLAHEGDALPW